VQSEVPSTRVVLLTARIDQDEVLEAIRGGVGGIVLKESAPRQIIGCVRKVAAGEQWLDESVGRRALDAMLRREAGAARAAGVLTPREIDITRMVARGLRNREIAEALFITEADGKGAPAHDLRETRRHEPDAAGGVRERADVGVSRKTSITSVAER
jgi:DNA-binding NarL/FixJ family response regulator